MTTIMTPPSDSTSPPRSHSNRPERELSRDEGGQIFCSHEDCREKNVKFRRPCEYNKHMDRHERPYRCTDAACEQNPGFTYSGGLLRHQREVHKMHLSKDPLFCPHSNCVRSSGTGFTRKENLEEHLRRRHSESIDATASRTNNPRMPYLAPLPASHKRSRQTSFDDDRKDHSGMRRAENVLIDSETVIRRLRMEVAQRDQLIQQLQQDLDRLRQLIASLPQVMYRPV